MAKQVKSDLDTFNDIFTKLDEIKKKLPNGELSEIKKSIDEISEDQTVIKNKISELNRRILDPETGLIVKVNRQGELIESSEQDTEIILEQVPNIKNRLDNIEIWQAGINKAIWLIFGSIIALVITALFQLITQNK